MWLGASCVCVWQYFYNPETCQFLYWNYETQSYHPVPTDLSATGQTETAVSTEQTQATDGDSSVEKNSESVTASSQAVSGDDKPKKEKVLHAKKIVKVTSWWGDVLTS